MWFEPDRARDDRARDDRARDRAAASCSAAVRFPADSRYGSDAGAVCSPRHKGHDDLTSSPPSSELTPAVSYESPP